MTQKELEKMIDDMFPKNGYNCAQTVLMCAAEYFDLQNELLEHLSAPFGGGLCGTRVSVCGAVSGALMFIGIKEKSKKSANASGNDFLAYIDSKYKNRSCEKILGINFSDKENAAAQKEEKLYTVCTPLVKDATNWLINRYEQ